MNSDLKAYLDKLRAETRALYDEFDRQLQIRAALPAKPSTGAPPPPLTRSAVVVSDGDSHIDSPVVAFIPDSYCFTAKAQEILEVAPDAPLTCTEMTPVTCSTECPTQVATISSVDEVHDTATTVRLEPAVDLIHQEVAPITSVHATPSVGTNTTSTTEVLPPVATTTDVVSKAGVQELDALSVKTTPVTSEVDHGVIHIVSSDLTTPTLTRCLANCFHRDTNLPRYVPHPAAAPLLLVLRPKPWPSFWKDHAYGNEKRPRPMSWPSLACSHELYRKHVGLLSQVNSAMNHFSGALNLLRESWKYLQSMQLKLPWPSFSSNCPAVPVWSELPKSVLEQGHWKFSEHHVKEHVAVGSFPRPNKMSETLQIMDIPVQWGFLNQEKFRVNDCFARECNCEKCDHLWTFLSCLMVHPIYCWELISMEATFSHFQAVDIWKNQPDGPRLLTWPPTSLEHLGKTVVKEIYGNGSYTVQQTIEARKLQPTVILCFLLTPAKPPANHDNGIIMLLEDQCEILVSLYYFGTPDCPIYLEFCSLVLIGSEGTERGQMNCQSLQTYAYYIVQPLKSVNCWENHALFREPWNTHHSNIYWLALGDLVQWHNTLLDEVRRTHAVAFIMSIKCHSEQQNERNHNLVAAAELAIYTMHKRVLQLVDEFGEFIPTTTVDNNGSNNSVAELKYDTIIWGRKSCECMIWTLLSNEEAHLTNWKSLKKCAQVRSLESIKNTYTLALSTLVNSMFPVGAARSDPLRDILHSSSGQGAENTTDKRTIELTAPYEVQEKTLPRCMNLATEGPPDCLPVFQLKPPWHHYVLDCTVRWQKIVARISPSSVPFNSREAKAWTCAEVLNSKNCQLDLLCYNKVRHSFYARMLQGQEMELCPTTGDLLLLPNQRWYYLCCDCSCDLTNASVVLWVDYLADEVHKSVDPRSITMSTSDLQPPKILLVPVISKRALAMIGTTPFTCYNQVHSQEGRGAIVFAAVFAQGFVSQRHYFGFDYDGYLSISHDYYYLSPDRFSELVQVHLNHGCYHDIYHGDPGTMKDLQAPWDPGELFVIAAWGQAAFQEGRDVRSPGDMYVYMGYPSASAWARPGCAPLRATSSCERDIEQIIQMDQANGTAPAALLPFPFLLPPDPCI